MESMRGLVLRVMFAGAACASMCTAPSARADLVDLTGQVTVHLTGAPVAGAWLSISIPPPKDPPGLPPYEIGSAITGADGSYEWLGLCWSEFGSCTVSVDQPPYLSASSFFPDNVSSYVVDLALLTPARVTGTVRFADGSPEGIDVTAEQYLDDYGVWGQVSDGITAADGTYAIGDLPPGTYRFCTGYDSHGAVRQCFDHVNRPPVGTDPHATSIDIAEGVDRDGVDFDLVHGGALSGTIYDGYLGTPLANAPAEVDAYDVDGNVLMVTASDASGAYRLQGVPDGTFYLGIHADEFFADAIQFYPGIVCTIGGSCPPPTSGQPLTIAGANEIDGLDFTVHPEVVIEGRVFDAGTNQGLGGVEVGPGYPAATSDPGTGAYRFYTYADAPQTIGAFDAPPYIDTYYPSQSCIGDYCIGTATPVSAPTDSVLTGIDLPMTLGVVISGNILRSDNFDPGAASVALYDENFNLIWSNYLAQGSYSTAPWLPGTYYVQAQAAWPLVGCAFYLDRPCPENGDPPGSVDPTPIVVDAGATRTGIDFRFPPVDPIFAAGFEF